MSMSRKRMRKRALGMLLACVMLFSGMDLTSLAAEPVAETGITSPDGKTETAVPGEENDTTDSAGEADGTDQQEGPDRDIDEEQKPGAGTDGEDAADHLEAGDDTNEDSAGDTDGENAADKPDDAKGEEEDNVGVGDADEEDQKDDADQSGTTDDEDESISENSVSENSVSENDISGNSLVTVNATNALGRYLAESLAESASVETGNTGCNVYEITLNGTEASVSFQTAERGTLVIGVYDEDSGRLAASGSVEVKPGDTEVTVPIETDNMPAYFVLRGFLVETESARPLGEVYETEDYTRRMQEFYAKTTADFVSDQILNLDESSDNNFLVFSQDVKVIRKSEDADVNQVIECDEINRSYKIGNPDENIISLQAGDIIAYYYDDNELIITKVHSMETGTEGDQTVASILGEDVDFDAVIEFIKVGAENPNAGGQGAYAAYAESASEYSKKWSIDDWSSEEDGEDGISLNLTDIGGESTIRLFRDAENEIETTELEITYGATASVDCKVSKEKRWELGNPTMPTNVPGVTLNCKIEVKLAGEVTGSYKGSLSGSVGVAIDEEGVRNIGRDPVFTVSESVAATISLGLVISPTIKFLHEKILSAVLEVDGGVKVTATIEEVIYTTEKERHACQDCLDIAIGPYLNITGKLTFLWKTKDVNLFAEDWTALECYYSVDYQQFGWGECPYKEYRIIVNVVKGAGRRPVEGARVNNESDTNADGWTKLWIPAGWRLFYAAKDGENGSQLEYVAEPMSVRITMGSYDAEPVEGNAVAQVYADSNGRTCAAVTEDGRLYCWGANGSGQLGDSTTTNKYEPVYIPFPGEVVKFNANWDSSAVIVKEKGVNTLYLWGDNTGGKLGDGTTTSNLVPFKSPLSNVSEVCVGYRNSAAIVGDGELYVWGDNSQGQVGNGESGESVTSPVRILQEQKVDQVVLSGSRFTSAAITRNGDLYVWGGNDSGQVGNGESSGKVTSPTPVLQGQKVKQVSLGQRHSAAVTEDGRLYLWGNNSSGQIGNGKTATQSTPMEISLNNKKVRSVYLTDGYSMAITEDGDLFAWGDNGAGTIGMGTDDQYYSTPQKIMEDVVSVEFENRHGKHNAAILKDGSLYLWGLNWWGEVGVTANTDNGVRKPTKVLDNVKQVSLGGGYTYVNSSGGFSAAVTADGSLWTWGDNRFGQLGRGKSISSTSTPAKVVIPETELQTSYALSIYALDEEPQITQDGSNSARQTAAFTGLMPNDIHNIYVMQSKDAGDRFGSDNLLYIGQSVSDADGNLTITYEMKEPCDDPAVFCVGMTRADLSSAQITVSDIVYDGEEHLVKVQVLYDGQSLTEGKEYEVYGDCVVKELGEYKVTVRGTGLYSGEREVTFRVKEQGDEPDDPDDPDDPDPEYGDILPGDIPADGVIPEGLWIAGIVQEGYIYTGKAIKPEVRVYDYKTLLKEKTDYTIAYKNNVQANITTAEKTVSTITVTGKGNYDGKETQTFKILPLDISAPAEESGDPGTPPDGTQEADDPFAADDMTVAYNGKVQKPLPVLMWNDKKLKNNTDYIVTYYDGTGERKLDSVKEKGNYYIRLSGKGNFAGTRSIKLTVTDSLKLISKATVAKIADQPYTGAAITPAVTAKDGKTTLTAGEHYTVRYSRNIAVGTAYAVITGNEAAGYSGTKRVSFRITGTPMSKAVVTGLTGRIFLYNGEEHEPELTLSIKTDGGNKSLTPGDDYVTTWQKNLDAGTATVVFTGRGGYSGTLKKTFKIKPFNIAENKDDCFRVALESDSVPYAKGGAKPDVTVTFRHPDGSERTLKEGRDYTLAYQNHTALNDGSGRKLPTVTIKGKGNFSGTYANKPTYKITQQNIGGLTIAAPDMVYQNKKNAYAAKISITDLDGKILKAGTDYEKSLTYTYKYDTELDNGAKRVAGTVVDRNDVVPAGTILEVTAAGMKNYAGTVAAQYRITQANLSTTAVTIAKQTYTGQAVTLDKRDITVSIKGKQVDESQYEIVSNSYKDNVKKGTATVTIRGVDNYGGIKTVKFTIKAKGFLWWWRK